MSEEPKPDKDIQGRTPQQVADDLSKLLGGFEDEPEVLRELDSLLNPAQQALVSDAFGLLNGMSKEPPTITVSQPRVQASLQSIISDVSAKGTSERADQLIVFLQDIITRAASAGLTADGQPIVGKLQHRLR